MNFMSGIFSTKTLLQVCIINVYIFLAGDIIRNYSIKTQ